MHNTVDELSKSLTDSRSKLGKLQAALASSAEALAKVCARYDAACAAVALGKKGEDPEKLQREMTPVSVRVAGLKQLIAEQERSIALLENEHAAAITAAQQQAEEQEAATIEREFAEAHGKVEQLKRELAEAERTLERAHDKRIALWDKRRKQQEARGQAAREAAVTVDRFFYRVADPATGREHLEFRCPSCRLNVVYPDKDPVTVPHCGDQRARFSGDFKRLERRYSDTSAITRPGDSAATLARA